MEPKAHAGASKYFYFSYGSNMLTDRLKIHDPDVKRYAAARLDGFKLDFDYRSRRWHGAVATIIESPEDHVWGVVWINNTSTIPALDEQEGAHLGMYKPIYVNVTTTDGEVINCRSYQMAQSWEMDHRPSALYKNVIIKGAIENGVPEAYIEKKLKTIEDNGYDADIEMQLDLLKKM